MVQSTRLVVVRFTPVMMVREAEGIYAMRIKELGLTGFGDSVADARDSLDGLFQAFIVGHRSQDTLEEVLSRSGLEWSWEDEYKGDLPYEIVTPTGSRECEGSRNAVEPSVAFQPSLQRLAA